MAIRRGGFWHLLVWVCGRRRWSCYWREGSDERGSLCGCIEIVVGVWGLSWGSGKAGAVFRFLGFAFCVFDGMDGGLYGFWKTRLLINVVVG